MKGFDVLANFRTGWSRRPFLLAVIVNSALCLALPEQARGQFVTFNFEATIVNTGGRSAFSVGETLAGSYTFDATAPDLDATSEVGLYQTVTSLNFVTSGGYSASASAAVSNGIIEVQNDTPNLTRDRYVVNVEEPSQTFTAPSVDGLDLTFLTIILRSSLTTAFPSDALPLLPPTLADFDRDNSLILGFGCCEAVNATLTSFTLDSPDPATQISLLMEAIRLLGSSGALHEELSGALLAKLDGAQRQAVKQPRAAAGMLKAFIEQVTALVRRGSLSPDEGQSLITAPQRILAGLTAE